MNLYTAGGFGDAAMSFAKAEALNIPRSEYKIFHARIRNDNLDSVILDFYKSVDVDAEILRFPVEGKIHPGQELLEWGLNNWKNYADKYLGTHWSSDCGNGLVSWEIEPFPLINYKKIENVKCLVSPESGGSRDPKSFDINSVFQFVEKTPESFIIGNGKESLYETHDKSFYNKTSVSELVNLIASSDVVISPEGFIAYFAAMCGKTVYCKSDNMPAIKRNRHPSWNFNIVKSLGEIKCLSV